MTDKQPDALALADALETFHNPHDKQAAAELRRLYFENEKLRAALAEQPAEPVAWMTAGGDVSRSKLWCDERSLGGEPSPLYTAPQPRRNVTYVCPVCAASLERQE